ncbi:MAG: IS481 family transposase [Arhodomonas sp.]|nr:IS481 family transposase [Arhodomonas sp.]
MTIHKQARTTPQLREEIRHSSLSERALAAKYNLTRSTVRKWKYREASADRSHRPHRLHTALSPAQEAVVVELRRSLLLSTDDLLVVVREFIEPAFNRSTLQRLLVRHGVSDLKALIPQPEDEAKPAKTFKDYQPGFVHVDIKYLPAMADEDGRTYLFVAIDRASRWVYLERHRQKSQKAATRFLKRLREKAPFHLHTLLTDNDLAFTDRFTQKDRQPSGQHAFDRLSTRYGIAHRLTPPRHPQTNGMVERFNGRIAEILRTTHFDAGVDLDSMLWHYNRLYNHHIPQRALGHLTPVQTLKQWYAQHPELFRKQVYDQSGLDTWT